MIETRVVVADMAKLEEWLRAAVRPHMTPDVSGYAKGRMRVWVNTEPSLSSPTRLSPSSLQVSADLKGRLAEIVGWEFDYCLVTYSGDKDAVGIAPHRDAAFADFEAYGLHVSGEALFSYWCEREGFGKTPATRVFAEDEGPSHRVDMSPGTLVHFNCKNRHACSPGVGRWNLNFWRGKQGR